MSEISELQLSMSATSIKNTIIELADRLETEEQIWEACKIINEGLIYLHAKHSMKKCGD